MPDHEHPPAASPDSPPWSSRVKIAVGVMTLVVVALAAPTIASLRILGRYVYAKLFELDPFPPPEPVPAGALAKRIGSGPLRVILPGRRPGPEREEPTPPLD